MKRLMRAALTALFLITFALSCKTEKTPPAQPPAQGAPKAAPHGTAPTSAHGEQPTAGSGSTTARVASHCPASRSVTSDDLAEVGGALYRAYRAALKGDTPEAFDEFQAAFRPDADRNHLKAQVFPRVVEHVGKYVAGPSDPSITLCRVEKHTDDRVKVFVQSRDPKKSDPPSLLVLRDGKWLLDSMTP